MVNPEMKLTKVEWKVYQYILANQNKITTFSLRQLALKLQVSPASVVRTINKMGFEHYQDLCRYFNEKANSTVFSDDVTYQAQIYFNQPIIASYTSKIILFKRLIQNCTDFVFFGVGTSNDLASYGARIFTNSGSNAYVIRDPFYPLQLGKVSYRNKIFIVLSVSGETKQSINQVINFRTHGAKIISITNNSDNTIAHLSDLNFTYLVESRIIDSNVNLTSQIPVIYILERLAYALQNKDK